MSGPQPPPAEASGAPQQPARPDQTQGSEAPQGPTPPAAGGVPAVPGGEAGESVAARAGEARLDAPLVRTGLFGVQDTPDTSGYGQLRVHRAPLLDSPRPYGSYFDTVTDALGDALGPAAFSAAVEHVIADRGELTFYVGREQLPEVARQLRDDPALRFEMCGGVSGVHYPHDDGRELHAVYHLLSITHNRRVRLGGTP